MKTMSLSEFKKSGREKVCSKLGIKTTSRPKFSKNKNQVRAKTGAHKKVHGSNNNAPIQKATSSHPMAGKPIEKQKPPVEKANPLDKEQAKQTPVMPECKYRVGDEVRFNLEGVEGKAHDVAKSLHRRKGTVVEVGAFDLAYNSYTLKVETKGRATPVKVCAKQLQHA